MTLENLIRIIIEAVDKIMMREKLVVRGLGVDINNREKLETAIQSVNGKGSAAFLEKDGIPEILPDVLFIDYLPIEYLAEIALGINVRPFPKYISDVLFAGKTIVVLGYGPVTPQTTPESYSALYSSYYKMIEGYGVKFDSMVKSADLCGETKEHKLSVSPGKVYKGNVLSKKDLLEFNSGGEILIGKGVIVTDLARDESENRKIKITRI